jgi:nicotinate phosphoribosyltransferase
MSGESILLTDLYQLAMLEAYFDRGMNDTAVFEFFVRKLPEQRNFLVGAGLEQVLDYLEAARFYAEDLDWLDKCCRFDRHFVDSLAGWRFTGDVDAIPEGTPFFPDEPILRVVAPLREAQLVETRIINLLQFQSMVASKAARCVFAAQGRRLVDFGLRRAHGAEAGLLSARASYLAGFTGSATVLANVRWGIPLFGTMAHSYVQAHASEAAAFENFARVHSGGTTLLIDTYDTVAAARGVVGLAHRLAGEGIFINGVRLDSGDLAGHAFRVRRILDDGQLPQVTILASGNLDELQIRDLVAAGAPIDGFGVGTRMNTSADAPYLDCAYKLQEYGGRARRKRSEGKATWPGRKQVWRERADDGKMIGDTLTLHDDTAAGEPLLKRVMAGGERVEASPSLASVRDYAMQQFADLPPALRQLDPAAADAVYPVTISSSLRALAQAVDQTP